MSIVKSFIYLVFTTILISCKAQTNEEKIRVTSSKIIEAIRAEDINTFKKLIGVSSLKVIGKDDESVEYDVKKIQNLYNQYLKDKKPKIIITNDYNNLGERKVEIPFYQGNDSINNISEVKLELYFGPPHLISLDKLSNYKLIVIYIKPPSMVIPPSKN